MIERNQVHEGMPVRSADGEKLGSVLLCEQGDFIVEKYGFTTRDYVVDYENVADISGGEILLSCSRSDLLGFDRKDERPGPEPETYGDEGGAGRG